MIYHERMKQLRERAGLTQKQLALSMNIAQNTYSQYETASRDLPIDFLIALADFYNVSADYILGRTQSPF